MLEGMIDEFSLCINIHITVKQTEALTVCNNNNNNVSDKHNYLVSN